MATGFGRTSTAMRQRWEAFVRWITPPSWGLVI